MTVPVFTLNRIGALLLAATERHTYVPATRLNIECPTLWTADAVRPSLFNEPLFGCSVVWENPEKFLKRNSTSEVFARCLVSHCIFPICEEILT